MNSIKSILSGIIFIFIASLVMQLAYLFIAVAYNGFAKDYHVLHEFSWVFRYIIAIPLFLAIMFVGGYLSAVIAREKVLIHSLIVGAVATGVMMWMALQNADLTSKGIAINLVMLLTTVAGALYWRKRSKNI